MLHLPCDVQLKTFISPNNSLSPFIYYYVTPNEDLAVLVDLIDLNIIVIIIIIIIIIFFFFLTFYAR